MSQSETPILLVVRKDGRLFSDEESVRVNYRRQGNHHFVDSMLNGAIVVARQLQPGSLHHSKKKIKMRILLIALLCACLGACAFQPLTRNNPFAALDEKIATDTVKQLARLYPPAKTQFSLIVSDPESFGALLADRLRAKGYALSEKTERSPIMPHDTFGAAFSPKPADNRNMPAQTLATEPGIKLRYVLDHSGRDFSRITMIIGGAVLARAYLIENGAIAPAGAWTFNE